MFRETVFMTRTRRSNERVRFDEHPHKYEAIRTYLQHLQLYFSDPRRATYPSEKVPLAQGHDVLQMNFCGASVFDKPHLVHGNLNGVLKPHCNFDIRG